MKQGRTGKSNLGAAMPFETAGAAATGIMPSGMNIVKSI